MCSTCDNVLHMAMIQLRHVPDDVHRLLKARAAQAGMSLSNYLVAQVERLAARPTPDELRARLASRTRVKIDAAAAVRAERDGR